VVAGGLWRAYGPPGWRPAHYTAGYRRGIEGRLPASDSFQRLRRRPAPIERKISDLKASSGVRPATRKATTGSCAH
jgi:hypothetical protein